MRVALFVGLSFVVGVAAKEKKKKEPSDGVPALDADGFDKVLKESENILVMFHKPAAVDGRSKLILPEYAQAAQILKSDVHVVKIDVVDQPAVAMLGVTHPPQIMFFWGKDKIGHKMEFDGDRSAKPIADWARARAFGNVSRVLPASDAENTPTVTGLEKFLEAQSTNLIAFSDGEPEAEVLSALTNISQTLDDIGVAVCTDLKAGAQHGVTSPGVQMWFNHDHGKELFTGSYSSAAELKNFVLERRLPMITPFHADVVDEVFADKLLRPILFFFRDPDVHKDEDEALKAAALTLRPHFLVTAVGPGDANNPEGRLMEFIGVRNDMHPIAVILQSPTGRETAAKKFSPQFEGSFTKDIFEDLVAGFKEGRLPTFIKSEVAKKGEETKADPAKAKKQIMTLVGQNMQESVLDPNKHVFVKIHADWCKRSKKFAKVWTDLRKQFYDKSVAFAEIDGAKNDLFGMEVIPKGEETFPILALWPKGEKDKPLFYNVTSKLPEMDSLEKWFLNKTGVKQKSRAERLLDEEL